MATTPALLAQLVDGATTDLDGGQALAEGISQYRHDQQAWFGDLMGLLVLRASAVPELAVGGTGRDGDPVAGLSVGLLVDTGIDRLAAAVAAVHRAGALIRRVEAAVAKRGEDPVPGVRRLLAAAADLSPDGLTVHAEIPLTGGLLDALDVVAEANGNPRTLGVTFRVGGLAGELFPPPATLAGVICACRDRGLRFAVSAGLHRAFRHNDHETGFAHHGVLNVLAACLAAAGGAGPIPVAERLATNDPTFLAETVLAARDVPRPLWSGFTTSRVDDLVHDLTLYEVLPSNRTGRGGPE